MRTLLFKILFGKQVATTDHQHPFKIRSIVYPLIFISTVFLLLYQQKYISTPLMEQQYQIAEACWSGQSWGLEALVSSINYPSLMTIFLLLTMPLAFIFNTDLVTLCVCILQTITILMVYKTLRLSGKHVIWFFIIPLLYLVPDLKQFMQTLTPEWCMIPLFTIIIYFYLKWSLSHLMRDIMMAATVSAVLIFTGLTGIILSVILFLLFMSQFIFSRKQSAVKYDCELSAILQLLAIPMLYTVSLYLLLNWLIMGDFFFVFKQEQVILSSHNNINIGIYLKNIFQSTILLPSGIIVLICSLRNTQKAGWTFLSMFILLILCHILAISWNITGVNLSYFLPYFSAWCIFLPIILIEKQKRHQAFSWGLWSLLATLLFSIAIFNPSSNSLEIKKREVIEHPSSKEITRLADSSWPGSRILLFGIKSATLYPDILEKRFQAKSYYIEKEVQTQAQNEQLHLLIPPNNNTFYHPNSPLGKIHTVQSHWLILVKEWSSGWQLWYCLNK